MKKISIIILSILYVITANSQEKKIISRNPQKVPKGKKWILSNSLNTLIEVKEGAIISGNLCNSQLLSNPRIASGIVIFGGSDDRTYFQKRISVAFKTLNKVAYANKYSFEVNGIITFFTYDYSDHTTSESSSIILYEGQIVAADACIENMEIYELSLTSKDIQEKQQRDMLDSIIKRKNEEKDKQQSIINEKNRKKEKMLTSKPFQLYELINKPNVILKDTQSLKLFINTCLLNKKSTNNNYSLVYDTTGKLTNVSFSSIGKINDGEICDSSRHINVLKDVFAINNVGQVEIDDLKYQVFVTCPVHIWIDLVDFSFTKQKVEIIKKRGRSNITMRDANEFNGYEYDEINKNQFTDTIYKAMIRDYIVTNSTEKKGINYYAKRYVYRVTIEYNSSSRFSYEWPDWLIYRK